MCFGGLTAAFWNQKGPDMPGLNKQPGHTGLG